MQLHGRDNERRHAEAALESGQCVVLRGAPGIGKTELWRAVLASLAERGVAVQRVVATATTHLIPGGALAGLVARVDPQATHGDRLVATLRALHASGRRFVLGVDDAHLLDDESAAALLQIALAGGSILLTARDEEPAPDAIVRFWKDGIAQTVALGPLAPAASAALVEELVAAPVDALTQARLHEASGGSPLLLHELVAHGHAVGALIDVGGVWTWNGELAPGPNVAAVIRARLAGLDPAARAIAELLAVGGPLPRPLLERLATGPALAAAYRAGVVRDRRHAAEEIVELAHPLYAPVLGEALPTERTQVLLERLIEIAEPLAARDGELGVLVAAWLVRLADRSHPAALIAAAERAFSRANLALAERLAHAALAAGGGEPAARIAARVSTFLCGTAPAPMGDSRDADSVMQAAIARADAFFVGSADRTTALAALAETQQHLVGRRRQELAALALAIRLHAGDPVAPILRDAEALLAAAGAPAVVARVALVYGPALTIAGRPLDAIDATTRGIAAADAAEGFSPYLRERLHGTRAQCRLFAGQLAEAGAEASERYALAKQDADAAALSIWSQVLAQLLLWQGKPHSAACHFGESIALTHGVDVIGNATWCHADLALCLAWVDPGAAESASIPVPAAPAPGSHAALMAPFVLLSRAGRHLCLGLPAEAEREAGEAIERARASEQPLPEILARHLQLRLRPTRARATGVAELASAVQGPFAAALAQSAETLVRGSAAELEQAAQPFAALGFAPLASEWFLRAAAAYRDASSPLAARRCGNAAAELRSRMEADPPLPAGSSAESDPLTPREHEVAALAGRGLTNHEIAARLGVSVRTVHAHLRTVYEKLGVNDRQRLATVLQRFAGPRDHDDRGTNA